MSFENRNFILPGLARLARCFSKHGVTVVYTPHKAIRQCLVRPKDQMEPLETSGIVYQIPCADSYTGHSGMALNTRIQEHKNAV